MTMQVACDMEGKLSGFLNEQPARGKAFNKQPAQFPQISQRADQAW